MMKWSTLFLLLFIGFFLATRCQSQQPASIVVDNLCGVRAIDYVLFWYEQEEDFIDILYGFRKSQGTEAGKPIQLASLHEISTFLLKHNIHCRAVYLPARKVIWDYPVILHMGTTNRGHFITQSTNKNGKGTVYWLGLKGLVPELSDSQWEDISGYALLTAPYPISDSMILQLENRYNRNVFWSLTKKIVVFSAVFLTIFIAARFKFSENTRSKGSVSCSD